jgi:hypothetical protein
MMGGRRTRRKQRGGNMYSFGGGSGLVGVPQVTAITNNGASTTGAIPASDISQAGGRRGRTRKTRHRPHPPPPPPAAGQPGGRRTRRKTRKQRGGKKARLMRGGAASYLPAKASAGFVGTGERGLANAVDVGTPMPNGVVSA